MWLHICHVILFISICGHVSLLTTNDQMTAYNPKRCIYAKCGTECGKKCGKSVVKSVVQSVVKSVVQSVVKSVVQV